MTSNSLDPTLSEQPNLTLETRSGTSLPLRAAGLHDGVLVAELFSRLSPENLRFRFLDTRRQPDPHQIAELLGVDHRHSEHVLAFDEASGRIVASLMLIADERMETAEVAIAVADDARDRGIGYALLRHAAQLACERGVKRLITIESSANHDALEVEQALGIKARHSEDDPGCVVLEADLG